LLRNFQKNGFEPSSPSETAVHGVMDTRIGSNPDSSILLQNPHKYQFLVHRKN
jgi:hypothetical protein